MWGVCHSSLPTSAHDKAWLQLLLQMQTVHNLKITATEEH